MLAHSWLFVPGSNEKALAKSSGLPAHAIIYDLEDAVSVDEKEKARAAVKEMVRVSNKVTYVRVNSLGSPYAAHDIAAVTNVGLAGIVLPKAEDKESILFSEQLLQKWERERGLPDGSVEIVPLIESARGLYHAVDIAGASHRVKRLMFGAVDFSLDINAQITNSGTEILYARSKLVIASRVAGIQPPIDTVFIDLNDPEGFLADTRLAKQLGFKGKLVIHPNQIGVVNEVFMPTKQEVEEAGKILNAYERKRVEGFGAFQLEGKMIDLPVVEKAKRLMESYTMFSQSKSDRE
ncbi:CoA ester lyase [Paenibacillus filicis]|uniref:CoA ester lyase n=1 Tax=Paenibacillus gyeongsangnamensis TaxID=3388067 RepID=A0ABT4QHG0_9BACL|nr:CoA ester lyase [Paenibacillus filicis]MCZ8516308.1 CoA ester lyase [Paenibacillus filicis]